MMATFPPVEHPVVRTHPETGRKGIYVNAAFTVAIKGMGDSESTRLLRTLYRQASIPELQCRFRWRVDSLAFWDNRSTQHYAVSDYWPAVRVMERATVVGDRPY
jgi:taurine dioxygenase